MTKRLILLVVALAVPMAAMGCGEKKEPLAPDNPNADPLMMEAGAHVPEGDAEAPSPPASK